MYVSLFSFSSSHLPIFAATEVVQQCRLVCVGVVRCAGCHSELATPLTSSDSDLSVGTEVTSVLRMTLARQQVVQRNFTAAVHAFISDFSFVVVCV